jgi:uncharacterized protein YbjT (DUF2867 family)
MRVLMLGATGMIGQGVLREALSSPEVREVLVVGRTPLGQAHPKLKELLRKDLYDFTDAADELTGIDACFFCLGVSAGGMSEADYRRITFDLTLALAKTLRQASPEATFIFISGAGTDGTGQGRAMWARVKGQAENALRDLRFKRLFLFRPAYIQPMDGIVSKTPSYRWMYAVTSPLYPLLKRLAPRQVTSTRQVGVAMVRVARDGFPKEILENDDINTAAA